MEILKKRTTHEKNKSLIKAVRNNEKNRVEKLLKNGADVNGKVFETEFIKTPLHYAAELDHQEIAKILIENGADTNAVDIFFAKPLNYAIEKGNLEMAELLLENSAASNKHQ